MVWNILTKGRMGENHLIGVDGEMSNITALRLILEAMGHGLKDFGWVAARPDRDPRYATHKCRISLQTFLLNQLRRINKSKDKNERII